MPTLAEITAPGMTVAADEPPSIADSWPIRSNENIALMDIDGNAEMS
jgi:hypothetical protein